MRELFPGDVIQIKPEKYRDGHTDDMQSPAKQGAFAVVREVEEDGVWANIYTTPIFIKPNDTLERYYSFYPSGTFVYIGVAVYPMFEERDDV